jgi:hypothetical protein
MHDLKSQTAAVLSGALLHGALVGAAALTLTQGEAQAQSPQQGAPAASGAQRFETPDGGVRFVLDRTGQRAALIKFEGSDEVHVLRPVGGPRGDEIYKTDTGDVMLRITPMGGVIVYRENAPNGAPAIMTGQVARISPTPPQGVSMRAQLAELERAAQQRFGRPVPVELPAQPPPAATGVVADAARRAAEGMQQAPPTVMRVERVIIQMGDRPNAMVVNRQLLITVAPNQGYEGRPSAAAVRQALQGPPVEAAGSAPPRQ